MKTKICNAILLASLIFLGGCKKGELGNYPGGVVSPYISIFDVREIFKGTDVTLTRSNMFGCREITGVVVSDHSGGNLPAGLLVLQDKRRLSELRGMSVAIGADAANYQPGDSVVINIENGLLKRVDGILQITGVNATAVKKISSGNPIAVNRVPANQIIANPEKFESVLTVIVKAGFNPLPADGEVLSGERMLNDGFGDLQIHTEATAKFANDKLLFLANYYGIVFTRVGANKQVEPQFRIRTSRDVVLLSSTVEVAPVIITGFISDVNGGDGNYEYMQFLATKDINFATSPYSVVVTNNANASAPTGYPANGWGTGGMRTFKFNLTSGFAAKGSFFYVGGTGKTINGASSTNISSANWIRTFNYTTTDGDGFGTKTSGLFANSGNASGFAIFAGTTVNAATKPVDAIFVSTGGSLFTPTPVPQGYRIANSDWYDIKNPITLEDQPFYRSGSNTLNLAYTTADLGYFYKLGGEYNVGLGRWMKARSQNNVLLTKASPITDIEGPDATMLK